MSAQQLDTPMSKFELIAKYFQNYLYICEFIRITRGANLLPVGALFFDYTLELIGCYSIFKEGYDRYAEHQKNPTQTTSTNASLVWFNDQRSGFCGYKTDGSLFDNPNTTVGLKRSVDKTVELFEKETNARVALRLADPRTLLTSTATTAPKTVIDNMVDSRNFCVHNLVDIKMHLERNILYLSNHKDELEQAVLYVYEKISKILKLHSSYVVSKPRPGYIATVIDKIASNKNKDELGKLLRNTANLNSMMTKISSGTLTAVDTVTVDVQDLIEQNEELNKKYQDLYDKYDELLQRLREYGDDMDTVDIESLSF